MFRREFLVGSVYLPIVPGSQPPDKDVENAIEALSKALSGDARFSRFEVKYCPDSSAPLVIVAYKSMDARPTSPSAAL